MNWTKKKAAELARIAASKSRPPMTVQDMIARFCQALREIDPAPPAPAPPPPPVRFRRNLQKRLTPAITIERAAELSGIII